MKTLIQKGVGEENEDIVESFPAEECGVPFKKRGRGRGRPRDSKSKRKLDIDPKIDTFR